MKQIFTIISVLISELLFGQSFEGTLVYKTEFKFQISEKMLQMGITEERMIEKMKKDGSWTDSIKTSYKEGNYITYTNFSPLTWMVYKQKRNRLYSFQDGEASDICAVTDPSIDLEFQMTGNKPKLEKPDTLVELNGMKCQIVRIQWKTGTYDYYYSDSFLRADPVLFENHIYDGWADFLKISKSLPIKIVKSVKGLATINLTLIRYTKETIAPELFEIPDLIEDKDLNQIRVSNREIMRIKK